MVYYILAIGLLVASVVWYLYGGLGLSGVSSPGIGGIDSSGNIVDGTGTPLPSGTWGSAGNITRDNNGTGKTGYSPPPGARSGKVTGDTHPANVPPSTGPAISSRSGVGHF